MKILKTIVLAFVFMIVFALVVALFVSNEMNYEKSITIDAPIDSVWENVNSLADLDKWSPWNDYDPNMKKEMFGKDGIIGAKQSWNSDNENVGRGSQTIANIKVPSLLETDLKFYEPFESEAKAYIKLVDEGNNTKVTWGFKSEMNYPFNLMKLFMNFEEAMDKDWNNGLGKLKQLSEQ